MYTQSRKAFYKRVPKFWADLYDEEYALFDLTTLPSKEIEEIRLVTERVGQIFFKTARLLRQVPDETLMSMGYPPETWRFLRLKMLAAESVIARLDLLPTEAGYKCIEINSDTPTFIKELFMVNGEVCKEFGVANPNCGREKQLQAVLKAAIREATSDKLDPYIVFTAHGDHVEDRETVLYLQALADIPSSRFVALDQLVIEKDVGLFDAEGKRIDVLYRQTFPIEQLIRDHDAEGHPIGQWLLDLVEAGKLMLLNPPSAFLLQNKAVQAVIWGLHEENHSYFSTEEHEWIDQYFLPTYLDEEPFRINSCSFVKKPCFGREGDTVDIFREDGTLYLGDPNRSYAEYVSVYQRFVEAKRVSFNSEKGRQTGRLLIGSFLLAGSPSALGCRVGGEITNNLSYYLPIGQREEKD